jgi:hypothetical protein
MVLVLMPLNAALVDQDLGLPALIDDSGWQTLTRLYRRDDYRVRDADDAREFTDGNADFLASHPGLPPRITTVTSSDQKIKIVEGSGKQVFQAIGTFYIL